MEAIFHILGTCGDMHSHIDLIDVIVLRDSVGPFSFKRYYKTIVFIIKQYISNLLKF